MEDKIYTEPLTESEVDKDVKLVKKPLTKTRAPTGKIYKKPKTKSPAIKVKVYKKPKRKSKPFKTTKHTLGKVHLLVEKESWQHDVEVPQYAVEDGKKISDHVQEQPQTLLLTGVIFKDKKHTVAEKIKGLKKYENKGKKLTYVGRRTGTNFLITKFSYESEAVIGNGHRFTIQLQEIRISGEKNKTKKTNAKGKTNGGKKQTSGGNGSGKGTTYTVKKGDTYWELAKKYDCTWQELYKLNKYPPRKIPIGVKLKIPA